PVGVLDPYGELGDGERLEVEPGLAQHGIAGDVADVVVHLGQRVDEGLPNILNHVPAPRWVADASSTGELYWTVRNSGNPSAYPVANASTTPSVTSTAPVTSEGSPGTGRRHRPAGGHRSGRF